MFLLWSRILSWGYGAVVILRNFLYDKSIKKSLSYKKPKLIGVGNLALGGTGKTPLVIYLTKLLAQNKAVAVLSRGYKRSSIGFKIIHNLDSALTAGDEPYLYYKRFEHNPNIIIAVCENRVRGIAKIIEHRPNVEIILLDDAFQHRSITPTLKILLTTFHEPFFKDYLFPLGRLREPRKGAVRADMILVTKSPTEPTKLEVAEIQEGIKKYHTTATTPSLFFTHIIYKNPILMWGKAVDRLPHSLLLVTGIATPLPLLEYLTQQGHKVTHLAFADHHWFNYTDILKIVNVFQALNEIDKAMVTTEKDSVRFIDNHWQKLLAPFPMFYIPIEMGFFQEDQPTFESKIMDEFLL